MIATTWPFMGRIEVKPAQVRENREVGMGLFSFIKNAGKKLGIAVHDHIIVGSKGFTSLRGQGLI